MSLLSLYIIINKGIYNIYNTETAGYSFSFAMIYRNNETFDSSFHVSDYTVWAKYLEST